MGIKHHPSKHDAVVALTRSGDCSGQEARNRLRSNLGLPRLSQLLFVFSCVDNVKAHELLTSGQTEVLSDFSILVPSWRVPRIVLL